MKSLDQLESPVVGNFDVFRFSGGKVKSLDLVDSPVIGNFDVFRVSGEKLEFLERKKKDSPVIRKFGWY